MSKQLFSTDTVAIHSNDQQNAIRVRAPPSPTRTNRDVITDFNDLLKNVTKRLKLENWIVVESSRNLYIFNLNLKSNGNLSIVNTINIDRNLTAKVFYDENLFDSLKLCRWAQLQTLVEQFRNNVKRDDDFEFECVSERKTKIEFQECVETKHQVQDTSVFEFCAVNLGGNAEVSKKIFSLSSAKAISFIENIFQIDNVLQPSNTIETVDDVMSDSLLKIKNEPPTIPIGEDTPSTYKCSECGRFYDIPIGGVCYSSRIEMSNT